MKEILIFAGTTEGRKLSECLAAAGIVHTVCVATEYGEIVLSKHPLVKVHKGRMDKETIKQFVLDGRFVAVADATHPFATEISYNIQAALEEIKKFGQIIPYLRLKRENITTEESGTRYFQTDEECAKALESVTGNILLTTGSKELSKYCTCEEIKHRLYVRVLPSLESISTCVKHGICAKQIIAMQGPFTTELNEAVIRQYKISCLVTKESGIYGGYPEKLKAAKNTETLVFMIGHPKETKGYSFLEICKKLEEITEKKINVKGKIDIILSGAGMGNANCLTKEVEKAINEADILLGSERILKNFTKQEKLPYYKADQIIPYLHNIQEKMLYEDKKVVVLFSGDSGFYSGCQHLYKALEEEIKISHLNASLHILSGISSVAYLASCIGESYQDAAIYSIHGKKLCNFLHRIKCSPKTFLLVSGVKDINWLGKLLEQANMSECEIVTGYQLSYKEQRIEKYTPAACCELKDEGLYTCFIKNPYAIKKRLVHGIADSEFIRGQVPMTKEEVREVSICKLRLYEEAVVYDIGSGTGSIAVEIASLSENIQVYAVEQKKEAVALIERNKEKAGLQNITVVNKAAPAGLSNLPMATHTFIGGSGGHLKEILAKLRQINPKMRVVITAVSIKTLCEIKEILSISDNFNKNIQKEEVVQLQVNRAKKTGNYHLMQSENPVWICAFNFAEDICKK